VPRDEIVLESRLTVHEATVHLRQVLEAEFADAASVQERASPGRMEIRAARDWANTVKAFRLVLTLRPREGGSDIVVATRASLGSLVAELAIASSACGLLLYKLGLGLVTLTAIAACAIGLPLIYRDRYRSERDRLRTLLARVVDARGDQQWQK
jgi:hypothetical protein